METVQPSDFVLIYFSGYGYQSDKLNYLLPIGFDPNDGSALGLKAFSVRNLLGRLDTRRAGTRMLLLDAGRPYGALTPGLAAMDRVDKTIVSFSAAAGQTVPDPLDGSVNSFTAALIGAIEVPGATPSSVVPMLKLRSAKTPRTSRCPLC